MDAIGTEARIHLPIEGQTAWPFILSVIGFGSLVTVGVLTVVLLFMAPSGALGVNPGALLSGVILFVIAEVAFVRFVIIPRHGNYGRFRILQHRIDLFPLSLTGFQTNAQAIAVSLNEYQSIEIESAGDRCHGIHHAVTLMHPLRSRMVRVRRFATLAEAQSYAMALSEALGVPKGETRK